jgi:hypothetical protein
LAAGSGERKRLAIAECRALSLAELCDGGLRERRPCGELRYLRQPGDLLRGRLTYKITDDGMRGLLTYRYWPAGRGASYGGEVALTREPNRRSYALCPGCGRRVRTLYAPPEAESFRCRVCLGLLYRPLASDEIRAYVDEVAGPALSALAALPEGSLPLPQARRRARLSAVLAEELGEEPPLGPQELRLWSLRLREEGLSYRRITSLLGCGKSSVARYCRAGREGIDRTALVRERLRGAAQPPLVPEDDDPDLWDAYSRQLQRYLHLRRRRAALRRPFPSELEERVVVPLEERP